MLCRCRARDHQQADENAGWPAEVGNQDRVSLAWTAWRVSAFNLSAIRAQLVVSSAIDRAVRAELVVSRRGGKPRCGGPPRGRRQCGPAIGDTSASYGWDYSPSLQMNRITASMPRW